MDLKEMETRRQFAIGYASALFTKYYLSNSKNSINFCLRKLASNVELLPEEKNPDQFIVRVLNERKQASLFDGDLK